ncbi:hypothetical protein HPB52_012097 [Rhipicephalus sanguineus]|uniref:Amino acid transporter n=1 Tax=Rhipicephalus sanguineus TaxID=34632 RepID=A0A9D4PEV0_RHISA|nr:hypothetical protein HPB52_012097 [Rhipicephalus sanguineus]
MYNKKAPPYDEPRNQNQAHYRALSDRERVAAREEETGGSVPPGDDSDQQRRLALRRDVGFVLPSWVRFYRHLAGDYAFFLAAGKPYGRYGDVPAFLFAWTSFFVDPAYMTIQGLTFSAYVLSLPYPNCAPPKELQVLVACLFISNHMLDSQPSDTRPSPGDIASALYSAVYCYSGWNCINCIAEEIKNPGRNIPVAIAVSTAITVVTYLLTNLAFFVVLDADTITSHRRRSRHFRTRRVGAWNGYRHALDHRADRVRDDGHLARVMSYVHVDRSVPLAAVAARCLISVAFALVGSVHFLIQACILLSNVREAASVVTLFLLSRSMPDAPRPHRVPIVVAVLRLVVCFALATVTLVQRKILHNRIPWLVDGVNPPSNVTTSIGRTFFRIAKPKALAAAAAIRATMRSDTIASTDVLAITLVSGMWGRGMANIMPVITALTVFGTPCAEVLATSRTFFEVNRQGLMYKENGPPPDEPRNRTEAKYRVLSDRDGLAAKEEETSCCVPPGDDPHRQRRLALRRDVGLFSSITFLLSATIGGLCAAELGALLPSSGGDYAFFLAAGRPYGKTCINYIAEEIKNPGRNIPIAIAVSTAITVLTYLLINLAFFVVLDADTITNTDVLAVSFIRATWGQGMATVMPFIIAMTVFGTTCASVLVSSRIFFAASRQGHLARVMSYVHVDRSVPLVAVVARCLISVAFALTGSVHFLIQASIMLSNVKEAASVVSLFLLRRSMPGATRPYRVPTVVAVLRLIVCFALATVTLVQVRRYAYQYALLAIVFATGAVYYYFCVRKKFRLRGYENVAVFVQKCFKSAPCSEDLERQNRLANLARPKARHRLAATTLNPLLVPAVLFRDTQPCGGHTPKPSAARFVSAPAADSTIPVRSRSGREAQNGPAITWVVSCFFIYSHYTLAVQALLRTRQAPLSQSHGIVRRL